jgi:hypothetical protein
LQTNNISFIKYYTKRCTDIWSSAFFYAFVTIDKFDITTDITENTNNMAMNHHFRVTQIHTLRTAEFSIKKVTFNT